MVVLQDMCDFTTDMARLKQLACELDNDRDGVTLLEHCKLLLKTLETTKHGIVIIQTLKSFIYSKKCNHSTIIVSSVIFSLTTSN